MNNTERFKQFKDLLEEIDNDYGFGPNEEICDENKINEYIKNFISYSKSINVYEYYKTKLDELERI